MASAKKKQRQRRAKNRVGVTRQCILASVDDETERDAYGAWLERWSESLVGAKASGCGCCVLITEFDEAPSDALDEAERLGILSNISTG